MELLAIWQGGLSGVCFALSEMGVEGAGGWGFIGEQGCSGGGGGVVVMEQVTNVLNVWLSTLAVRV
jgi:hypothetical protein